MTMPMLLPYLPLRVTFTPFFQIPTSKLHPILWVIFRRAPHLIKRGLDPVDGVHVPSKLNPTDLPVLILNLLRLIIMEYRLRVPPRVSKIVIRDLRCSILQQWPHLTRKDLATLYNTRFRRSRLLSPLTVLPRTGFHTPALSSRTYTLTINRRCSHQSLSFLINATRRTSQLRRTHRSQATLPIRSPPLRRQRLPMGPQDKVSRVHPHISVHHPHSIP